MSRYTETVTEDTPKVVINFSGPVGQERFDYRQSGQMPIMNLIGYLGRVQTQLYETAKYQLAPECERGCPDQSLVIAYYPASRKFGWFCHHTVNVDAMCGFIEILKVKLVATHQTHQVQQQQSPIIGLDNRPFRRN